MKRVLTIVVLSIFVCITNPCLPQQLVLSTKSGKTCKVNIMNSQIHDNQVDVIIGVTWVTDDLKLANDNSSVLIFKRGDITKNLPSKITINNKEGKGDFMTNSSLKLTFDIDETFPGGNIVFNFPFEYSSSYAAAKEASNREEFTFKRPREFNYVVNVPANSIINKQPPQIVFISPYGIEDGLKPITDTSIVNVRMIVKDATGIGSVAVNNIPASKENDTVYIASVKLKVGFENTIIATAMDSKGLMAKKQFTIVCNQPNLKSVSGGSSNASLNRTLCDVDIDIPSITVSDPKKFALIIGNEDYSSYQKLLNRESNVEFAVHDAEIFKEYGLKTLGIPDENIIMILNAKAIEFHRALSQINTILKNTGGEADLYVFYAGHGFPDETTHEPYLIPVDVSGSDLPFAIKLNDFYKKLTEFPSKRVTIFIDACFSGGGREKGLLASRGIRVKPKENALKGNLIVFTASTGDQSALPYQEKQHGLFTYYLLKKLKEAQTGLTYKELSDYLASTISVRSVIINNKEQNPQTNIGFDLGESWKEWKIK